MPLTIRTRLMLTINAVIVTITLVAALSLLLIVFWFERSLFYRHLESDLQHYRNLYQSSEKVVVSQAKGLTYYQYPDTDTHLIPSVFLDYAEGGHEWVDDDNAYNFFIQKQQGWTFLLVQNQDEFEYYENLVIRLLVVAVIALLLFGFFISKTLTKHIMQPISRLALYVRSLPQQQAALPPKIFTADEIGQLAEALEFHRVRIQELLWREQQFSANVSHELRTPMMVLRAALDMLQLEQNSAQIQKQLPRMNAALNAMQRQIELFLQLARTPDSLAAQDASAPVQHLVEQQLDVWRAYAEHKGLTLVFLPQAGITRTLPASSFVAVLNNLLRNAVLHTEKGTITLHLSNTGIMLCDTGTGIEASMLNNVTQRGITDHPQGFGLGLAIVEQICQHQNWHFSLQSNSPRGVCARVSF